MARKSRQRDAAPNGDCGRGTKVQLFSTAGYVRLSEQDRGDGASIENQELMVRNYIEQKDDMKLYAIYSDNGATGTNFQRSGFESLMEAIRGGKVNCVVVKDLSRFGRDYIEAGNYIEIIFPRLGVRFLSIGDNYDSFDPRCKSEGMSIALKNMINAFYAKDISVKTRTAKEAQRRKGEFSAGIPPFGYVKSDFDRHKLVVDPDSAPIVRDIFRWKLDGMTLADIRKRLNDSGIPTPGHYRYLKGIHRDKRCEKPSYWHDTTVLNILENIAYLGHLALGKCTVDPNQPYKYINRPKDEWVITENTHEAIITQGDFDAVAAMLRINKEKYRQNITKYTRPPAPPNIFAKLAFCSSCGRSYQRISHNDKNVKTVRFSYGCPSCKRNAPDRAERRYFKEKDFIDTVYAIIRKQIDVYADTRELAYRTQSSQPVKVKQDEISREIRRLSLELERFPAKGVRLYNDYCDGILSESDYRLIKSRYESDNTANEARLAELQNLTIRLEPEYVNENRGVTMFERFADEHELTREMLTALVERIEVGGDLSVHIVFKYRDELEELASFIAENGGNADE